MAKKDTNIVIRPLELEEVEIAITGTTPLIVHAWDEKAKREMLEKQQGKKTSAKHSIKIPMNDFMASMYWLTDMPEPGENDEDAEQIWENAVANDARFGFPVTGIKQSIISGAYRAGLDVKQTELRGTFFLKGLTEHSTNDIAEIIGDTPEIREDMVRVGGMSKSADIRYRAEFNNWEIPLKLLYFKNGKYTLEQILNFINYGGFMVGIGEWRPEKYGQFGMYQLKID